MLKGLGFSKKKAPSELQIQKHRDQTSVHYQWKNDLGKIRAITEKLDNTYKNHKGDFSLGRYGELKDMVKCAVKEHQDCIQKTQKQNLEGAATAIANKYRTGQPIRSVQGQGQCQTSAGKSGGGLLSKIKKQAQALTSTTDMSAATASKNDIKDKEMATWGYDGMSSKQVEEEIETRRKEILQFKQDFRRQRDTLDHLAKEYEDSKKYAPPQRYTILKCMIKSVIT